MRRLKALMIAAFAASATPAAAGEFCAALKAFQTAPLPDGADVSSVRWIWAVLDEGPAVACQWDDPAGQALCDEAAPTSFERPYIAVAALDCYAYRLPNGMFPDIDTVPAEAVLDRKDGLVLWLQTAFSPTDIRDATVWLTVAREGAALPPAR